MQYSNLGFAFGFCLLSLVFPVDLSNPESRYPFLDGSGRQEPDPAADPQLPERKGMGKHLYIVDLIAEFDQMIRSVHQARGYRRITAHNVLEHETRKRIYDLICSYPGIDLSRLADLSECNERTLRYHIDRIAEERMITVYTRGKSFHFFENHSTFSLREQTVLAYSQSGQTSRIISLIQHHPGITRRELADYLGVASPTVTRMVRILADQACIRLEKDGKYTRHYLMPDTGRIISGKVAG